jgi:hypothetical protein
MPYRIPSIDALPTEPTALVRALALLEVAFCRTPISEISAST